MAKHIDCPRCGEKAIVRSKGNVYQCSNCDFKREFAPPPQAKPNQGIFWASITATIVSLLILQARCTTETPRLEAQIPPALTTILQS